MARNRNESNQRFFWRFLLWTFLATVVVLVPLALWGCGNKWPPPINVDRPVVFHQPVSFPGGIVGNVTITASDGSQGNLNVAGTVTAEDVNVQENLDVGGNTTTHGDNTTVGNVIVGGDVEHVGEVVQIPELPPPPPPDDEDDPGDNGEPEPLVVTLSSPFIGLLEEGMPPSDCVVLAVGNFNVEAHLVIDGEAPFTVKFRNYYGSVEQEVGDGPEVSLFFDAAVPTTTCVSSQVRVTDAEGNEKNLFFYLSVR